MDIEEIMIDFFEGEAPSDLEKIMFTEIGKDEELIETFKNHLAIDRAARTSLDTFTSPPELTNAIFRKLGYSIPAMYQVRRTPFAFLKNKVFTHTLVSVASILLTIFMLYSFFNQNKAVNPTKEKNKIYQNAQGSAKQLPFVQSKDIKGESRKVYKNNFHSPSIGYENGNIEQLNNKTSDEENLTLSTSSPVNYNTMQNVNEPFSNLPLNAAIINKPIFVNYNEPAGLSFAISNTPSWNVKKEKIPLNSVSPFNNLAVSLYYELSEYVKIGAEARQETHYTEYDENGNNDTTYLYYQQSNLTTFSANARFYPYDIWHFQTYLGFNIGLNKGGIIAKPNIGLEYEAYPDLAFALGFEYSYFFYQHKNKWFRASKVGFNYGVIFKI